MLPTSVLTSPQLPYIYPPEGCRPMSPAAAYYTAALRFEAITALQTELQYATPSVQAALILGYTIGHAAATESLLTDLLRYTRYQTLIVPRTLPHPLPPRSVSGSHLLQMLHHQQQRTMIMTPLHLRSSHAHLPIPSVRATPSAILRASLYQNRISQPHHNY